MPVVAHHSVCPECHELAADDSAPVRSQEPDVLLRPQDSDTNVIANETGCGTDERAEGSPETSEPLPDASQPVPIESLPLQQSHAVQSYAEAGVAESSTPPLTNSTETFSFTPAVSCMLATPPTSTLPENGIEGAHGDGCGVAASLISRRTETILKHRHADIRPRDRNERYEQVNMRYEDGSDDDAMPDEGEDVVPNPILEVGRRRVPSVGRGCLFPGSLFRGKQTSGRSSYDVEVRILDVSFPTSTISGYLSISHLTETHPRLTTFFSGEIIGSTYGFLTGPAFYSAQATESDDMRHWSRFEHFQKVKGELKRPGLTMRDEGSISLGQGVDQEKPFCFMRWKERFLVPDHKVRDISGASFAAHRPAFATRRSSQSAPRPPPRNRGVVQPSMGFNERAPGGTPPSATRVPPSPTSPTAPGLPRRGSSNRAASASGKTGYALPVEPLPILNFKNCHSHGYLLDMAAAAFR